MKVRNKKLIACLCALSLITGITPYCKDIAENISITASAETYEDLTYELVDENLDAINDYAMITDCNEEVTNIEIPAEIDGLPVKVIGDSAFYDCANLENITIPDSITNIGSYAFCYCTSLKSITIPDSITNIGSLEFCGCTSLESITIPEGVENIEMCAFSYTGLESIIIPDSVRSVGAGAFLDCTNLKSITFENPYTKIFDESSTICNGNDGGDFFNVTIYGYENSTAESYAAMYGYPFVALDTLTEPSTDSTEPVTEPSTEPSTEPTEPNTEPTEEILYGDANNDGKVNVRDCAFIAAALAKGTTGSLPINADFNNDGKINVRDAAAIANHLATEKTLTDVSTLAGEVISLDEDSGVWSSDYVTCEIGDGWWYTKTAGYYGVVIKQGDKYYPLDDKDPTEMAETGYATFEEALKLTECSADTKIAIIGYGVNTPTDLYIAYSSDGTTVNVICVDEAVESTVEEVPVTYPSFTGTVIASDELSVTFSFDLYNPAGTGFTDFIIQLQEDDTEEYNFYDFGEITDNNGTTAKVEYTFWQNGKYRLTLANGGNTGVADLTIDTITGITEIEGDPEDVIPPEVTVEFDETVTGLALGNIFPIKITTNEPCYIRLDGMTSTLSTEFETFVRSNGSYIVMASDDWGNTTKVEIEIRAFGDGKLPEEMTLEDIQQTTLPNDNPLTGSDRDSYWDTVS